MGVVEPVGYPKWQSHKVVEAFEIEEIVFLELGGAVLRGRVGHSGPALTREVDARYVDKHGPQVGGFWVRYEDGYESWSPAQAFKQGYTLLF